MEKFLRVLGIIAVLIVASIVGYLIFKFALGLLVAILVGIGCVIGYFFCRLIPPKKLRHRIIAKYLRNQE